MISDSPLWLAAPSRPRPLPVLPRWSTEEASQLLSAAMSRGCIVPGKRRGCLSTSSDGIFTRGSVRIVVLHLHWGSVLLLI